MESILAVCGLFLLVALLVDLGVRRSAGAPEGRGWFGSGHTSAMGGVVGELTELFQPGRRIEQEERKRQREARLDQDSGDPPFGVDLEAGTARIDLRDVTRRSEERETR